MSRAAVVFNPYYPGGLDGDVRLTGSGGARVARRRPSSGADFAVNAAGNVLLDAATSKATERMAKSPDFVRVLTEFMRSPKGRLAGGVLAGVPIAIAAIDELNKDPTNPGGNLAGAAGAAGLGTAGAVGGAVLGGTLVPVVGAPIGAALGGAVGSVLGGAGGRNLFDGVNGLFNDPFEKELRQARRVGEFTREQERLQVPITQANMQMASSYEAQQLRNMTDADSRRMFTQAMLAAALGGRQYSDPSFTQSLAAIASQGLVRG